MSRTTMHSIDPHNAGTRRAICRRALWIGLSLLVIAAPAQANRILQVRVGKHPTFTRLVFEMDAFTGYQVERRAGTDGTEQLTVTLEASTPAREITSNSVGIESVRIAEGTDQATAQILLRKPGLQMKEMILSNPPRIVLDFVHSAAAVAEMTGDPYAKPAPTKPKPEVAEVVAPKPAPKPAVVESKPAPKPAVAESKPAPKSEIAKVIEPKPATKPEIAKVIEPKPAPKPEIAKVIEPKPATKPEIAKVIESKPAPKPEIAKVIEPKPEPVAAPVEPADSVQEIAKADSTTGSEATAPSLAPDADRRAALRESIPGAHKRGERTPPVAPAADSSADQTTGKEATAEKIADAPLGSSKRAAKPSTDEKQRRAPSPSDVTRRIEKPKPADSGLPFNAITLAGIALGALIVLVVAVRVFRKRSLPHDLDVTAFADASEDDDNASATEDEATDQGPAEEIPVVESPAEVSPPLVEEQNTAAYSLSEVAAKAIEPDHGLYDDDSEGEKPMDMDTNNLPTERGDFGASPAAMMSGVDNDMSQLVQELANRIANLETRLDEANDSRERLERQVAAQSEELRVQRAAIARTQRALRSLSRSEEDQATEPALREPSQPTR